MKNVWIIFLSLLLLFGLFSILNSQIATFETKVELAKVPRAERETNLTSVRLIVPAVDSRGRGVATTLIVEARPGNGRVLTDIEHLLFFLDTQNSIQIAKYVAEKVTGINASSYDLIYQIETNASAVGGPSAGAALTIATIAALEKRSLNKSVVITGTIEPDGTIGMVGGVREKAMAAKQMGAKLFLVPKGQGKERVYKPIRECRTIGPITFCTTEFQVEEIDISESVGIKVVEVSNIEEALKYFGLM